MSAPSSQPMPPAPQYAPQPGPSLSTTQQTANAAATAATPAAAASELIPPAVSSTMTSTTTGTPAAAVAATTAAVEGGGGASVGSAVPGGSSQPTDSVPTPTPVAAAPAEVTPPAPVVPSPAIATPAVPASTPVAAVAAATPQIAAVPPTVPTPAESVTMHVQATVPPAASAPVPKPVTPAVAQPAQPVQPAVPTPVQAPAVNPALAASMAAAAVARAAAMVKPVASPRAAPPANAGAAPGGPLPMPPQLVGATSSSPMAQGSAPAPVPGPTGGEWRDKDADRSARQQIARIILTLIMKSANRPASVNYNPREIARRLEHTLYMSASSRDEYSNVHTLKARLQQALDNSRRRQMQIQQQGGAQPGATGAPAAVPTSAAPVNPAMNLVQQQQLQAQQLQQQQQLQILQRQQQQQLAAQLHSQRNAGFAGMPFPGASASASSVPVSSQPLQMPLSMQTSMAVSTGISSMTTTSATMANSGVGSTGGNSILDELEREADEMANGVSDEPLSMPESEMQLPASSSAGLSVATSSAAMVASVANTFASSTSVPTSAAFNSMPLSMPPEIGGLATAPATSASLGFVPAPTTSVPTQASGAPGSTSMYNGMNLTPPQLQQIQQLQQIHQLRRMQQLQQLQQQQQVANAAANIGLNATIPGAAATTAQLQATAGMNVNPGLSVASPASNAIGVGGVVPPPAGLVGGPAAPGMMQMSEAAIAQKREELKRRLIQLKHARTCTATDCSVDYCARTKALLNHVSRCANAQCTTIGCKSTRQLLSHFRKCRNLQCEVCSAIRPPMNETEQQLVLRRQQERLCMLRHASTCAATQCVLPYCSGMRVLWKHICECHQRQCRTDHCISSRYVLSHFKQCNKMICEVCGPVRKAIKIVDSCKGNLPQLQIAASQVPEGVRNLIKIMNTMQVPNTMAAAGQLTAQQATANAAAAAGGNSGGLTPTQRQGGPPGGAVANAAWLAAQQKAATTGNVKLEAGLAGGDAKAGGATGSVGKAAASIKTESKDGVALPSSAAAEDSKKKPVKFQTEKEKKLRRKEQAKIAKARVQAKAAAAAGQGGAATPVAGASDPAATIKVAAPAPAGPAVKTQAVVAAPAPVPTIHLSNGLVVRGSQAKLRAENDFNQQDISFLDSMTESQLDEHIRSLRFNFCGYITLTELKNRLLPLLNKLMESEYGWVFNNPVDPVQWNIPDYFDVIKCPMDLGTIKKRLEQEHYYSVETFASDVRLVFENCIAYNASTNNFNVAAKQMLASFDRQLASLKSQLEKQLFKRCELRKEEMCQLCGGDSFKFAPCMLFCSGPCTGRIRRHTHYYSDPRGEHHWCSSCFKQMKDGPIDVAALPQLSGPAPEGAGVDVALTKSSLLKRKNSEVAEEPWVECDSCKLWYHQICALFNERNHAISGEQEPFVCPICVKKQRAKGVKPNLENGLKASRLPITRMAKLIEDRVLNSIKQAHEEEATRMGNLGNADSIGFIPASGQESKSETQFGVTVREVLSIDKQVQIKPKMGKILTSHYGKAKKNDAKTSNGAAPEKPKSLKRQRLEATKKKKKTPAVDASNANGAMLQLTYRSRCICVFQELDGVDVLIFTLYVQEYSPDSLAPNAGRVYVSYLDSVNYFQPKKLRTLMHQQVMLGFLEDCRDRGFHTCHIWSCPPLKGDDYIFFCKPENQKIPKAARLRSWYQKLLQEAKKQGLVTTISNLYAEYYLKKKAAHELPYFEGDYWPRLAEDLIKQIEEKGSGARDKPASAGATATVPETAPSVLSAVAEDENENDDDGGDDRNDDDDMKTAMAMSPVPSDENAGDDAAASAFSATNGGKGAPSKGKKSKKKRSKKGGFASSTATRSSSSTTKTRSKKGSLGLVKPMGNSKNVINSDPIMQKLKGILEPQKDDFFVVDLHPRCHKCQESIIKVPYWELKTVDPPPSLVELLDAVKKTRAGSSSSRNAPPRHYHHYYCASCHEINKTQLQHRVEVAATGAKRAREICDKILPLNETTMAAQVADLDMQEIKYELALVYVDPSQEATKDEATEVVKEEADKEKEKSANGDVEMVEVKLEEKESAADSGNGPAAPSETSKEEPSSETAGKSASAKAPVTSTAIVVKKEPAVKVVKAKKARDLDDVIMPCEIFDTREAFLMYCQNNHCQFDQLRRAKHSSMMVLYHLFNQGTTGFTFSCSSCKTTLLSGNRWNCSICPVFNLCDDCNAKTKHEHQLHLFKIVAIPRPGADVVQPPTIDPASIAPTGGLGGSGKRAQLKEGGARGTKRDAMGGEVKRAKSAAAGAAAAAAGVGTEVKKNRKRKLTTMSPTKAAATPTAQTPASAPAPASASASASAPPAAAAQPATAGATPATGAAAGGDDDPNKKKPRIHNIDPALLLQLEHASGCVIPECTFTNCQRMRSMLKHGAMCEQRLAGPCVLCKRIVGLLSAHARQCQKEYTECKVPRCADIRRHFLMQMQQRQEQMERLRQAQTTAAGAAGSAATTTATATTATTATAAAETSSAAATAASSTTATPPP